MIEYAPSPLCFEGQGGTPTPTPKVGGRKYLLSQGQTNLAEVPWVKMTTL